MTYILTNGGRFVVDFELEATKDMGDDGLTASITTEPADDVPNLDAMGRDELREWAQAIPTAIPEAVRALLWRYAHLRADAIEQREVGRIQQSLRIGHQQDALYRQIPEPYRW